MVEVNLGDSFSAKVIKGGAKQPEPPCHKNPNKKPHCMHLAGVGFDGTFVYKYFVCCWCGLGKKEKQKIDIPEITEKWQLSHGPYYGKW